MHKTAACKASLQLPHAEQSAPHTISGCIHAYMKFIFSPYSTQLLLPKSPPYPPASPKWLSLPCSHYICSRTLRCSRSHAQSPYSYLHTVQLTELLSCRGEKTRISLHMGPCVPTAAPGQLPACTVRPQHHQCTCSVVLSASQALQNWQSANSMSHAESLISFSSSKCFLELH